MNGYGFENEQKIQQATIAVLKDMRPFESLVVGEATLERIAKGAKFSSVSAGHKLELNTTIGLIASIYTIVQMTIAGTFSGVKLFKNRSPKETKSLIDEQIKQKLGDKEYLDQLFIENPNLILEIIESIERLEIAKVYFNENDQ